MLKLLPQFLSMLFVAEFVAEGLEHLNNFGLVILKKQRPK